MSFNIKAMAITCSLMWGAGIFFYTWWMIVLGNAIGEQTLIGMVYPGYSVSAMGSIWGLLWGLFDGLLGGAVFAWLYNTLQAKDKQKRLSASIP